MTSLLKELLFLNEAKNQQNGWGTGRWAAKKLSPNDDPMKASFELMFADVFKTLPVGVKDWFLAHSYPQGGNGIFDVLPDFMEEFEDMAHDSGFTPASVYEDLVKLAETLNQIDLAIKSMEAGYVNLHKVTQTSNASVPKIMAAYKKQKALSIKIDGHLIEFRSYDDTSVNVEYSEYPIYVYVNSKLDVQASRKGKALRTPMSFDADWMMQYVWVFLVNHYSVTEVILSDAISRAKVKLVAQEKQPSAELLADWYGV